MTRRDAREQQVRNRLQHARWEASQPPLRLRDEALTVFLWLGLFAIGALFAAAVVP